MYTHWMIQTHGDPIGSLQALLVDIWEYANLDALWIPTHTSPDPSGEPYLLRDPKEVWQVNPFKPLMTLNAAKRIPDLIRAHAGESIGVLLRPCEMRALVEMSKHTSFPLDRLLTLSIDCLGTYPLEEYLWQAERKTASTQSRQENLQFARQGGILPYRYRSACQLCEAPNAETAQINIQVLGLPVRQQIIVSTQETEGVKGINFPAFTAGPAQWDLLAQREHVLGRMVARRVHTRERVLAGISDILPENVDKLIGQFEKCGACQKCMQACPICSVAFPRLGEEQKYLRQDVMRWLVSCAGCGMCELACPNGQPLSAIFGHVRRQLAQALDYFPGRSFSEPLPIA